MKTDLSLSGYIADNINSVIDINSVESLQSLVKGLENQIAQARNQNRLLRIGIIGQIKRGKSSFLNSLLFNGQDILPKAATPMTAALTRISYSEQPQATVEFYTEQEWLKVTGTAQQVTEAEQQYQTELASFQQTMNSTAARRAGRQRPPIQLKFSDEQKACCELVRMIDTSGINVRDFLGKEHCISACDNSDLVGQLQQFVGAEGQYTPIVKSTELKLNVEGLDGIEVVDTPGMNDPIISRGRRTQEFIGQCDVVFFLSYCSQFMDMHDMGLLAQNIPNKGIKDIVLIGSVFDSALLDEYHNYSSIQEALPAITQKLNNVAAQNVQSVCQQGQGHEHENYIFDALNKALPPIFISSRCFDLAIKGEQLSEEEIHSRSSMNRMFPGFEFTAPVLSAVANFNPVHKKLAEVQANKKQILAGRVDEIMLGAKREQQSILNDIQQDILHRKKVLEEGDLDALVERQGVIVNRLKLGEQRIVTAFEQQTLVARNKMVETLNGLKQVALDARRVETQSGSRQESYEVSRTVSTSSWYNPFSWGSSKTVYSTEYRTVSYSYANVQDAVDRLETFVYQTDTELNKAVQAAVNINQLKQSIKDIIKDMFDFSDDGFDPQSVMLPLEAVLSRLTMPTIQLDLDKHIDTVRQQFTSIEVENDDIGKLRQEQARIVGVLLEAVTAEVDSNVSAILSKLNNEKEQFIPELTKDLNAQVVQLGQDLQNSEQKMTEYNQVLALVSKDLAAMAA